MHDHSDFARNRDRFGAAGAEPFEPAVGSLPESDLSHADVETTETGTTIVAIAADDGVLMAADQRASLAGRIVSNKNVQKIEEIQHNAALSISGSVGGAQAFIRALKAETNLYEARRGEHMSIPALATYASLLLRGGPYFLVVPLLGGVDDDGGHVFSLDPSGSSLSDDYSASGSGMGFALGVLEQEYEEGMSMDDAQTAAARAIDSATERDTASGDGIHVARITREDVDVTAYDDVAELL
ncbi:MAG: proteasome subunit beta [Halobacteriaceae archaeon]